MMTVKGYGGHVAAKVETAAAIWQVTGGKGSQGIVVRHEQELESEQYAERLAYGARIIEIELVDRQLHFSKISGEGPDEGWIPLGNVDEKFVEHVITGKPIPEIVGTSKSLALAVGDIRPKEPGTGAQYEVVAERVAIRAAPSLTAVFQFHMKKGTNFEMFDWDETKKWRQVVDKVNRLGWVMLDHQDHGPLVRPVKLPFQVAPLPPIVMAAIEKDLKHLKAFCKAGVDLNATDAGGRTALMHAASNEFCDGIVLLCISGANMHLQTPERKTLSNFATSPHCHALVSGLLGAKYDEGLCQEAFLKLEREVKPAAEQLLGARWLDKPWLQDAFSTSTPARPKGPMSSCTNCGASLPLTAKFCPECGTTVKKMEKPEPATPQTPSSEPSPSELLFRVAIKTVPIRTEPTMDGKMISCKVEGDLVFGHSFDASQQWIEVDCEWKDSSTGTDNTRAWMLVEYQGKTLLERL